MNRPDPILFAKGSYYLGFATSGLLLVTIVLMLVRATGVAGVLVWLTVLTSAVGTFMAWAARKDFQTAPPPPDVQGMVNLGWRINRLALILIVLMIVIGLIVVAVIQALPAFVGE
jgi:hypothetical protein